GAGARTAPPCAAAACPGSGSSPPARHPRPEDPPWRFARTIADAGATRFRDQSVDSKPAFAGCLASKFPPVNPAIDGPKNGSVQAARRADRPTSTRPIVAADAAPSLRAALAHRALSRVPEASDRPETKRAACGGERLHQRLRFADTKLHAGYR